MSDRFESILGIPPEQQAIRAKCFHPSGSFIEFRKEEVEQSIPSRFEQMARTYPDRIAVKTRNRTLTYDALNKAANRVARAILAERGQGEEPIALLLEQGAPMIVAIIGVLKGGKCYVPLDSSLPRSRITYILEELQAPLIVTNNRNLPLARELARDARDLLNIDEIDSSLSVENLGLSISPDLLAYILYTSGSTGQPKGVMHNHRNVLHDCMAYTNNLHFCAHDRLTLLHSCSYSASKHYLFGALLNGAAIYPFDINGEGLSQMASWLIQEKVTIYHSGVVLYRYFLDTLTGKEEFPHLRLIKLGSQQVSKKDLESYKKQFPPDCILVNALSSTEAATVCWHFIDKGSEITGDIVPVGHPVEDMEVLLLDDDGKEVGFNQIGEIAVRSRYLALGYWRRPDPTRTASLPGPQAGDARIYRTGDLGLMASDGCLTHLGRKDFQVKIRGYRIELGEIEAALLNLDAIKHAAVVTRGDEIGDDRLVAYVVPSARPGPTTGALRCALAEKLPDYMIPSAFVVMDALPLLPNGKVDRGALPTPHQSQKQLGRAFIAPRTLLEETLAGIWAEVLGSEQVGIHDNFFDLGGHSLLATRVISRIHDALQVELSLSLFFENPTVAALAGYIESARPPQDGTEALCIQPASRDGQLFPSFAQQRLWFLDQLEPGSIAYNLFSATQLTGRLNVVALEQSFNEIVRRHESLRTVFKAVDGQPRQIILPSMTIKVAVVDLQEVVSDTERESEVRRLSTVEAQRPFDLTRGPLLRATLVRLTEDGYVLLLTIHHIVFDGWSIGILAQELSALYEAFSSGHPASLPALPIQYADFAQWQRKRLEGKVLEAQLAYWRKQLEGLSTLELPTDRPRPPVQAARGARQYFVLSETLCTGLKNLSNRCGATLFMTLLGAYQTLLHRYTGQNDIVTGSPVAGRNRSELERLIGFFLNMLVLRTDLSGNPTFRELLARVREVCLEAYAHQDLPFEKLVEELQPERDLSRNPLFQATFALQNTPRFPLELAGLTANDLEVYAGIARFDLHLFLAEEESGLRGYVDYNTDLLNAATITRMLSHFQTLLESIVANPDERIGSLPLLTETERSELLLEYNDTKRDYPKDKCVHELFEAQVERSSDAVAVVFDDKHLTYRELNERGNQLAHYLRKLGVGPEVLVGICMERSLEMIVGIFGVLKTGGAYVPLDPEYPKERLEFMLEDSRTPVLLTQRQFAECLPENRARVIYLDIDWEAIGQESKENPVSGLTTDSLAYVIYTSGSTGRPKGVMIDHRGICNRLFWMQDVYRLTPADRVLQKTPFSFDVSVWEFFWPLWFGARLVMAKPKGHQDSAYLANVIAEQEITTLHFVPSMLQRFLEEKGLETRRSLRRVICSGEVLSHELQQRFFARLDSELHNLYGPTEASVDVTYWPCQRESCRHFVPIGWPVANTRIYVLGPDLDPVPVGVGGEIYIGGVQLARGYLNRADLAAERFIPNPFSQEPGGRLYRTGDMGRYLSDGSIQFLGRIDHQVKIRGFRIELGEIEAVLRQDSSVQEAVVTAREDSPGDRRLVAYVVPGRQIGIQTVDTLSAGLQEKQVSYWKALFDETFQEARKPEDPATDMAGVNSSYTNEPLPAVQSRDWVEHAARRILSLKPSRVLDIGCGLGRMLFRVAPYCSRYWGTDFSQVALDYVEGHVDLLGEKRGEIKLIRARADDFGEIPKTHFDTVVINGVIQYFPNIDYLVKVLRGALNAVEPGGVIFVGDVRSLRLLEAFQLSVDLHQAPDDLPTDLLWQRVRRNIAQEEELVVDPTFFHAIRCYLSRIGGVEILLKRGWAHNELTRFRYDVILHVEPQEQPCLNTAWLDWGKEKLTLASVRERLLAGESEALGIVRVPNARVLPEVKAAASLARGDGPERACELRDAIGAMRANALHPEAFWALGEELSYSVDITWSNTGGPEFFDVFLQRHTPSGRRRPRAGFLEEAIIAMPWRSYAHNPIEAKLSRALRSSLRSLVEKQLPNYMMPSAFVVLDALPLTPNGKVDYHALPAPDQSRPEVEIPFKEPRTPVEEALGRIWAEVLGVEQVGVDDNFFDLGGHSLLATQVIARVNDAFQIELPLRVLFEEPTVGELAAVVTERQAEGAGQENLARMMIELEALSDEEAEQLLQEKDTPEIIGDSYE